jgi:hypothetical protein
MFVVLSIFQSIDLRYGEENTKYSELNVGGDLRITRANNHKTTTITITTI